MSVTILISADSKKNRLQLKKLWSYRALLFAFARRDIRVHYAQTRLGLLWSLIQAGTAACIVSLFFSHILRIQIPGIPYILYAFPGMTAWYLFSYIVSSSGTSLLQSQHIIKKIYFPKLLLPLYRALVGLVEFLVWFVVFAALMLYFRQPLSQRVLLLPLALLLNLLAGLSVGIWLSALTVRFRDAFHIIPFLIGFGVFVTPVFFQPSMIPGALQAVVYLNPMAGVIALYRWCLLGSPLSGNYLWGSLPLVLLLISGLFYFRRVEGSMADLI